MNYQLPTKQHAIGHPNRRRGEITGPDTMKIADRFKSFQRKTTENILEMARVVIEAKQRPDFTDFCILIGYSQFSSTIRKLEVIGQKYEFLISKTHRLPPSWTTIYKVSQLDEGLIEENIKKGYINPEVTGGLIDSLAKKLNLKPKNQIKPKVPNGTFNDYSFTVTFSKEPKQTLLSELESFIFDLGYLGGEITISKGLELLLDPVTINLKAA